MIFATQMLLVGLAGIALGTCLGEFMEARSRRKEALRYRAIIAEARGEA